VSNCTFKNVGGTAIHLGVLERFDTLTVTGCQFIDILDKGIWLNNSGATEPMVFTAANISGNTLSNCGGAAIAAGSSSSSNGKIKNISITGNIVDGCGGYGIHTYGDADVITISDNIIRNSGLSGTVATDCIAIQASGAQTSMLICNNVIENFYLFGISVGYGKVDAITGNVIKGSAPAEITDARGIHLRTPDTTPTIIANNIINETENVKYSIYITNSGPHYMVRDNYFQPGLSAIGLKLATCRNNIGYVTENSGSAATVADGGTIAHGCVATPTKVIATGSVAGEIVTVTSIDATNITVAIKKPDGSAGTAQTVYWRAEV
jgi:hypothetical protein